MGAFPEAITHTEEGHDLPNLLTELYCRGTRQLSISRSISKSYSIPTVCCKTKDLRGWNFALGDIIIYGDVIMYGDIIIYGDIIMYGDIIILHQAV